MELQQLEIRRLTLSKGFEAWIYEHLSTTLEEALPATQLVFGLKQPACASDEGSNVTAYTIWECS